MGKKGTRFTVLAMCGSPRYVQTILLSTFNHIQTLLFTPLWNIHKLRTILLELKDIPKFQFQNLYDSVEIKIFGVILDNF